MVGKPKWLGSPAPTRTLDVYRVRPGGDGVYYVMEHRGGRVEIYGRLVGMEALERAEGIAKEMNEKEAAA